jgi:uncharacterized protein
MKSALIAVCIVLIIEGLLPLVAPAAWRETMRKIGELADGQLRFVGLLSVLLGAVGILVLTL